MNSLENNKDSYYSSRYTFNPLRNIVWKEIVKFHQKYIPKDSVVVDLGAGYCDFINNIIAKKKYAVDTSSELAKYANNGIDLIPEPAWNLSLIKDNSVDVVHASNLFEHFTDEQLEKTMLEIKRVLKKEGSLY